MELTEPRCHFLRPYTFFRNHYIDLILYLFAFYIYLPLHVLFLVNLYLSLFLSPLLSLSPSHSLSLSVCLSHDDHLVCVKGPPPPFFFLHASFHTIIPSLFKIPFVILQLVYMRVQHTVVFLMLHLSTKTFDVHMYHCIYDTIQEKNRDEINRFIFKAYVSHLLVFLCEWSVFNTIATTFEDRP